MTPIEIINSLVAEKLDGNIQRLANFPLGSLRNDKVYGCPGRNFDSDDTELMRAIFVWSLAIRGRISRWII